MSKLGTGEKQPPHRLTTRPWMNPSLPEPQRCGLWNGAVSAAGLCCPCGDQRGRWGNELVPQAKRCVVGMDDALLAPGPLVAQAPSLLPMVAAGEGPGPTHQWPLPQRDPTRILEVMVKTTGVRLRFTSRLHGLSCAALSTSLHPC